MQPPQYDSRLPAEKDNGITQAAAAGKNLDAAITMQSAETELQNTKELCATAPEIEAPKQNLHFEALFKRNYKRKSTSCKSTSGKLEKIY